jgi:acetyltransferase-like isoleucine patch superfamily enzyme
LLIRFKELGPAVKTKGDVTIGNDVWVGYDTLILSGVTVGDGTVVAGNPARVIKYRFSKEKIAELLELKWWDLPWKILREKVPWLMKEPAS